MKQKINWNFPHSVCGSETWCRKSFGKGPLVFLCVAQVKSLFCVAEMA